MFSKDESKKLLTCSCTGTLIQFTWVDPKVRSTVVRTLLQDLPLLVPHTQTTIQQDYRLILTLTYLQMSSI